MFRNPRPGTPVNVTYTSPRDQQTEVRVQGVTIDGRYPHMYLNLDGPKGVQRIPHDSIVKVERLPVDQRVSR